MPATHLPLSRRLDAEWIALRRRPAAIAAARTWRATTEPFGDLDDLLALAGYRVTGSAAANEVLLGIVAAARHDDLAARVVLQRILPGLLGVARRRHRADEHEDSLEELVGAAWIAIRSCRVDRRPAQVAANLVRDAAYRAFTAPSRRRWATEVSVDPRVLDETPATTVVSAFDELAGLVAEARAGGMDPADLQLVRDLVGTGSPRVVADQRGVTPRTVRNHRDRVAAALRRLALAA